jgi:ATP-dependent Clp protease ATP-binding subunit ClpA
MALIPITCWWESCEKGAWDRKSDRSDIDARRAELEVRVLHSMIDPLATPLELTEALRRVLALAAEESHWFGHHYIGTEHLLLALARSRSGGSADLLRTLAISPDQIKRRVRLLLSDGVTELSIEAAKRMARLSELTRRVLNAASQVAAQEKEQSAGVDHLLLVLAREGRSRASRILRECGLNETALQAALGQMPPENELTSEALLVDVIDHAVDRADQLGTHYTGTDHVLLALARIHTAPVCCSVQGQPGTIIRVIHHDLLPPPGTSSRVV